MSLYENKWKNELDNRCQLLANEIKELEEERKQLIEKKFEIESKKDKMSSEEYVKQYSTIDQEYHSVTFELEEKKDMLSRATSDNFDYAILSDQKLIGMGIPATISSNREQTIIQTDMGSFPRIEFKTPEELDAEYMNYMNQINEAVKKGEIIPKAAKKIQERLFFTYATYIKHSSASLQNSNSTQDISNPKYQEFISDIQRLQEKIADLADKRDGLDELLNQTYLQINGIGRDISFNERAYQKLSLEIKAKEIEIKILGIEASINNYKNFISQKELGLDRMEGKLDVYTYSYQVDNAKANTNIRDNVDILNITYEENELYSMQIRFAAMQLARGEITEEQRNETYNTLQKKVKDNDAYIQTLNDDISNLRRKQIEKQIAFRYSQGLISKETRQAQLQALGDSKHLTENSQVDISNTFVDEQGQVHGPRR